MAQVRVRGAAGTLVVTAAVALIGAGVTSVGRWSPVPTRAVVAPSARPATRVTPTQVVTQIPDFHREQGLAPNPSPGHAVEIVRIIEVFVPIEMVPPVEVFGPRGQAPTRNKPRDPPGLALGLGGQERHRSRPAWRGLVNSEPGESARLWNRPKADDRPSTTREPA